MFILDAEPEMAKDSIVNGTHRVKKKQRRCCKNYLQNDITWLKSEVVNVI